MPRALRRKFPSRGSHGPAEVKQSPTPHLGWLAYIWGRCAFHIGLYLYCYRGDSYHPWRPRCDSRVNSLRDTWRGNASGHRNYSLCGLVVAAGCTCVDCWFMGSSAVKGPDRNSVGDNTLEDRERTRLSAANWVRRQAPQQWDVACAELAELIATLGLQQEYDPPAGARQTPRTKIMDCGPVSTLSVTRGNTRRY